MLEAIEDPVDDHARDRHIEPHRKRPSGDPHVGDDRRFKLHPMNGQDTLGADLTDFFDSHRSHDSYRPTRIVSNPSH